MFPSSLDLAHVLQFDLGVLALLLLLTKLMSRDTLLGRIVLGATAGSIIATYAAWRWSETLPQFEWSLTALWPYLFFALEAVAISYTMLSIAILMRHIDRSSEADAGELRMGRADVWPAVDVFICTHSEPAEVVEKSIIPALAIDYPNVTVWVLDDTRREWLADYCARVGANYITRPDNKGAKAGNLNNGLHRTAQITNAPFILVLDADFAPSHNILRRTIGLFHDPKTAVVQTPQFFFNADPIQHNLAAAHAWVDDQRIFFDVFQPSKDAWGCAFCVGTSFVVRRDRLNEIGGFPDGAICEDINLTYQLMRRGYETHWLNEPLSAGLSAEGLPEYITQRTRWCLGTIQVALLKDGPFRGKGYTFLQRLHYFHGVLNWLCKPFVVMMLIAPSVYWFCGLPAFHADYLQFLRYGLPALFALWVYGGWISGQRTLPLFMEVTHTLPAPAVTATLLSALFRPFGRPFKVTDKGGDRSLARLRVKMAAAFGAIAALSAGGIVWSMISPDAASEISPIDMFNLVWAGIALVLSFVAFLVCFERPRFEERFVVNEVAALALDRQTKAACRLHGLSLSTASLVVDGMRLTLGMNVYLFITGIGLFACHVVEADRGQTIVAFEPSFDQRRLLLEKLYTAPCHTIASQGHLRHAFAALYRRAFRPA